MIAKNVQNTILKMPGFLLVAFLKRKWAIFFYRKLDSGHDF
jgi:hypothetical protein